MYEYRPNDQTWGAPETESLVAFILAICLVIMFELTGGRSMAGVDKIFFVIAGFTVLGLVIDSARRVA